MNSKNGKTLTTEELDRLGIVLEQIEALADIAADQAQEQLGALTIANLIREKAREAASIIEGERQP